MRRGSENIRWLLRIKVRPAAGSSGGRDLAEPGHFVSSCLWEQTVSASDLGLSVHLSLVKPVLVFEVISREVPSLSVQAEPRSGQVCLACFAGVWTACEGVRTACVGVETAWACGPRVQKQQQLQES